MFILNEDFDSEGWPPATLFDHLGPILFPAPRAAVDLVSLLGLDCLPEMEYA